MNELVIIALAAVLFASLPTRGERLSGGYQPRGTTPPKSEWKPPRENTLDG